MWKVPRIWEGGECWIIGGGPSVTKQFNIPVKLVQQIRDKELSIHSFSPYMSFLHDKHVIGVNLALFLGDWLDIIFFGDYNFYLRHLYPLRDYPGIKVFGNPKGKNPEFQREGIKFLGRDMEHPHGLTKDNQKISWNSNSGAASINLAIHLGIKKIYLLGFDMFIDKHNQHWHNQYRTEQIERERQNKTIKLPFSRHLKGFPLIAKQAKKWGIEIINVSPDSEINNFPKISMKDIL